MRSIRGAFVAALIVQQQFHQLLVYIKHKLTFLQLKYHDAITKLKNN